MLIDPSISLADFEIGMCRMERGVVLLKHFDLTIRCITKIAIGAIVAEINPFFISALRINSTF
jgi:hypothetical protein